MWSLSANFLNETPLASFEPLISILNGDLSGFNRLVSQILRAAIPLSSAQGVLANAIDSAQKDIQGEIHEYLMNRLPGLKNRLPNQIDVWTGTALNDINNPWLRILNAMSPFQVSNDYPPDMHVVHNGKKVTAQEVITWLQRDLNFSGLSKLNMDSSGSYEYSTNERQLINKQIGSQEMWKQIVPIMMNKEYQKQLNDLRSHRSKFIDLNNEEIVLKLKLLPVYKEVEKVVRNNQKLAEKKLQIGAAQIVDQLYTDNLMEQGNVEGAAEIQKINLETLKHIKYNNN